MLRTNTQRFSVLNQLRLRLKRLMFPGTNWVSRDKSRITRLFLNGTPDRPIQTLDCGCGNAYFAHKAIQRHAECLGITIHDWEQRHCEEMRAFLGLTEKQLQIQHVRLDKLAADPAQRGRFDQVLLLDVIEHIMNAPAALRQIHALASDNGLLYITTPNRDWQGNADRIRVTRVEDGWHVRNGYTFEQLESVLEQNGFEPVDRLRFGTRGSSLVTWIQHRIFGKWIDPLTVLFFPFLKLLAVLLSPWKDPHTICVIARKVALPTARARRGARGFVAAGRTSRWDD